MSLSFDPFIRYFYLPFLLNFRFLSYTIQFSLNQKPWLFKNLCRSKKKWFKVILCGPSVRTRGDIMRLLNFRDRKFSIFWMLYLSSNSYITTWSSNTSCFSEVTITIKWETKYDPRLEPYIWIHRIFVSLTLLCNFVL